MCIIGEMEIMSDKGVFFKKVLITYSERMTTAMLVVVANVDTLVNLVDNVCTVM